MKKICVIGSMNIDIVSTVDQFAQVGETVKSKSFELVTGGKGANQAVAAGKLGADVMMVGRLGEQFDGAMYLEVLKRNNVKCHAVDVVPGEAPGTAIIPVNARGENMIYIYPGTNEMMDVDYIDRNWESISACDLFLFQFEIPMETNAYAIQKLKQSGKLIILDPAPAETIPDALYGCIDYITPNEVELQQITGVLISENDVEQIRKAARILLEKGVKKVIAKAGKYGAYLIDREDCTHFPALSDIKVADTTAAGDSFNAGFAYGLSIGKTEEEAIRIANIVAGIATTSVGAQGAMPDIEQVKKYIEQMTQNK